MTISHEDQDVIEREADAHWHHGHQIPRTVNRVDGCDCGGIERHRVDCTIHDLDREQVLANIAASRERSAAYCAEINRIRNSRHRVRWEALFTDLEPSVYSPRPAYTRVPTGACELTCMCGWSCIVPAGQVDTAITEHEGTTP